jgi:hypothetical protein
MVLARHPKKELKVRRTRQAISKNMNRLQDAASKQTSSNLPRQVSVSHHTGTLFSSTNGSNNLKRDSETIVTASNKSSSKKQKTKS